MCSGTWSVTNAQGDCAGRCDGMCQGTCELSAGGSCSGKCEGSCEYTPPSGTCEADAQVSCKAMADASVQCNGSCKGEVEPPMAKAECQASAKAEANANVQCFPPSLEITWQWSASLMGDVNAQAEFKAWLEGFKLRYSTLLAALKKAELVIKVGGDLTAAAGGAVEGAVSVAAEGDVDLKASIGLGCALVELKSVGKVIGDGTAKLQASVSAAGEISTAIAP